MKHIRRILSFLLAVVMVFAMLPPMTVSADETDLPRNASAKENPEATEAVTELIEEGNLPTEILTEQVAESALFAEVAADPVAVTSIEITAETDCIAPGETLQLTATILPENATNKVAIWSSSDQTIAAVDENGLVEGISVGDVYINATVGGKQTKYRVSVVAEIAMLMATRQYSFTNGVSAVDEIIDRLDRLSQIHHGKYWNRNYSEENLKNQIATNDVESCLGMVGCPTYGSVGCTSNTFNGRGQCNGYAHYLAYLITGNDRNTTTWTTSLGSHPNKVYLERKALSELQPGDIIAYDNGNPDYSHWVMVWKIEGNQLFVAEANNGVYGVNNNGCIINYGKPVDNQETILSKMTVFSRARIFEPIDDSATAPSDPDTSVDPPETISVAAYLAQYAQKVTSINKTVVTVGSNPITTWKLPWTNTKNGVQDTSLKLGTISGEITLIREVVNHAGNIWYEYETGTSTRGFVYHTDVSFETVKPYCTVKPHSEPTEDNAVLYATWNNPSGISLTHGGFRLGTNPNNLTQYRENVASSWETAESIPCSYDLKNEYDVDLQPSTTYYYQFFIETGDGAVFSSEMKSFTTEGKAYTIIDDDEYWITENMTLSENILVAEGSSVYIDEGVTVTVPSGIELNIQGYVEVYGNLIFEDGGILTITDQYVKCLNIWTGKLDVTKANLSGIHYGSVGFQLNSSAEVKGIPDEMLYATTYVYSTEDVNVALSRASDFEYLDLMVDSSFTLTNSITIPNNTEFFIWQWNEEADPPSVVIPNGVTVTNNGWFTVDSGRFVVEQGGKLINNNYASARTFGVLLVLGDFQQNGTFDGTYYGSTMSQTELESDLSDCAQNGYSWVHENETVIDSDMTIDLGEKEFRLSKYGSIIVADGATLTVNSSMNTGCWDYGDLECGKIIVKDGGKLIVNGNLQTNEKPGTELTLEDGASLEINGTMCVNDSVLIEKNTVVEVNGSWIGYAPVNNGGTILPAVTSISVSVDNSVIDPETTEYVTLNVSVDGGSVLNLKRGVILGATWTSSDPDIIDPARIVDCGMGEYRAYLGDKTGKVILTATSIDGSNKTAVIILEVIQHGDCGENLSWELNSTGCLKISGSGSMTDFVNSEDAPWHNYRTDINTVLLPDGLTSIGNWAFADCVNLKDVNIPNSATIVGKGAFYGCSSLTEITIPLGIQEISASIFAGCSNLTKIYFAGDLPKNSINAEAFLNVTATVYYPAGNKTWTETVMQDYGGDLTWKPYCTGEHTIVEDAAVAPNCTDTGLTEGKHCSVCGEVLVKQEVVDALGHDWREWDTVDATCTVDGSRTRACKRSGCNETETQVIPATGEHIYDQEVVDAKYLVSEATSTTLAVYRKSCKCGAAGEETFTDGELKAPAFKDVPEDAYYYDPVMWAVEKGVTNGYGEADTFAPDIDCTRGQIVTFLWRAAGSPEPASSAMSFDDVEESDFYYKAVLWAVENGITNGYGGADTFAPNVTCTRGQVVTMLNRYLGGKATNTGNPFDDVKEDAFYYGAVLWAAESGITTGTSATTFDPDATCTRGQIVTFLYRALYQHR